MVPAADLEKAVMPSTPKQAPKYARKVAVGLIEPDETLRAGVQGLVGVSGATATLPLSQLIGRANGNVQTRYVLVTDRNVYVAGIRGFHLKVNQDVGKWPLGMVAVERLGIGELRVGDETIFVGVKGKDADAVVETAKSAAAPS
jgi:hypothetical protein